MKRRNMFEKTCEDCLHIAGYSFVGKHGYCLLGNGTSKCAQFLEDTEFQLMGKHIPVVRHNILHKLQNSRCSICNKVIAEGEATLDHDHIKKIKGTGKVRGVLCRTCNSFIAKCENNAMRFRIDQKVLPDVLRATASYLQKKQYPYIHPSEKIKVKGITKQCYNKIVKTYRGKLTIPPFPTNGKPLKLTMPLRKIFEACGIEPEYYK